MHRRSCHRPSPPGRSRYVLLTLPYLACQAKKYNRAASGCPTRQKLTQKMQLPTIFPVVPSTRVKGRVIAINGSWMTMPRNATPAESHSRSTRCVASNVPRILWVGTPTASSCKKPEKVNTMALAAGTLQPRPIKGEKTCRFIKL